MKMNAWLIPLYHKTMRLFYFIGTKKETIDDDGFLLSITAKSILYVSSLFFYFDIGKSHFEGRSLPQFAIDFDFTFVEANQLFHYR